MKQYGRYQTQGMISPIKWLFSGHTAMAIYHNRIKATKRRKQELRPLSLWGWFKKRSYQETKAQWLRLLSL